LREQLENQFPGLRGMTYQIAVDKKIAATDTPIPPQSEVALLPPFSGG
jgi:molybdopterin converting factor small subunit